jgi:hypothetical protein
VSSTTTTTTTAPTTHTVTTRVRQQFKKNLTFKHFILLNVVKPVSVLTVQQNLTTTGIVLTTPTTHMTTTTVATTTYPTTTVTSMLIFLMFLSPILQILHFLHPHPLLKKSTLLCRYINLFLAVTTATTTSLQTDVPVMTPKQFEEACIQPVIIGTVVSMLAMVPVNFLAMFALFIQLNNTFNPHQLMLKHRQKLFSQRVRRRK